MFGFIVALAAGFITPTVEEPLAKPLARAMAPHIVVEPGEMRVLAFMLMMIAAGIVASVFGTGSALGLAVGGALGYFAARIVDAIRKAMDGRKGG